MLSITKAASTPSPAQRRAARALSVDLSHPAVVYLASVSEGSRYTLLRAIRQAAKFFGSTPRDLDWTALNFGAISALRSYLAEEFAPATANKVLCAVRGVLRAAVKLGAMPRDAMMSAVDVPAVRGHREQPGRSLSSAEIAAMMAACANRGDLIGRRDRAILALAYGAGLRRIDIAQLDVESVRPDGDLLVLGKGNKERLVPLDEGTRRIVGEWIAVRGAKFGPLFVQIAKARKVTETRLQPAGISFVLERIEEVSGVQHFTPHDLRRTYVGDMFDLGIDIRTIQELVGHATPATTARYDRRPHRVRREAVAKRSLPF